MTAGRQPQCSPSLLLLLLPAIHVHSYAASSKQASKQTALPLCQSWHMVQR